MDLDIRCTHCNTELSKFIDFTSCKYDCYNSLCFRRTHLSVDEKNIIINIRSFIAHKESSKYIYTLYITKDSNCAYLHCTDYKNCGESKFLFVSKYIPFPLEKSILNKIFNKFLKLSNF